MPDAEFLTEAELAAYLILAPATLKRWRNKRKGPPYIHAGDSVRYPRQALEEWLAERTVYPEGK